MFCLHLLRTLGSIVALLLIVLLASVVILFAAAQNYFSDKQFAFKHAPILRSVCGVLGTLK